MKWDAASALNAQQREDICKSIHEQTGYGPAQIKDTQIVDAYLKFSDSRKYKPVYTQMLACTKDNKSQYTYYVTQGVDKNGVTLIHQDPSKRKIKGKDIFQFWWIIGQVRVVPTLQKLAA